MLYTSRKMTSEFFQQNCYLLFTASTSMPGRERLQNEVIAELMEECVGLKKVTGAP